MRSYLVALLVALPTALVTWILTKGFYDQPGRRCAEPAAAAGMKGAPTTADPDQQLRDLMRSPVGELTTNGPLELYDAKGLFEYINGAAPLYIDRNFRKLAAAEMKTPGGGELTCDVYDMGEAKNAAAIYQAETTPQTKALELGDEGRQSSMSLVFRHGPYYVKLTAFDAEAEATLPALAKTLDERMP